HAHQERAGPARARIEPLAPAPPPPGPGARLPRGGGGREGGPRRPPGAGLMTPFRRRRPGENFSDEIQAHLAHEIERLIEQGMTPDEARHAAAKAFGHLVAAAGREYESRR